MKKILMLSSILITVGLSGPAYDGDIEFEQRDGSTFTGNLKGDEWFSWIEDKDKNIIIYNEKSENYEYAIFGELNKKLQLLPSGKKVKNVKILSDINSKSIIPKIDKDKLFMIWKREREDNRYVKPKALIKDDLSKSERYEEEDEEDEFSSPPEKEVGEEDENGDGVAISIKDN